MNSVINLPLFLHPYNWVVVFAMLTMLMFFLALLDPYLPEGK